MTLQSDDSAELNRRKFMDFFQNDSNRNQLSNYMNNPEKVLQELGIEVDDKFKRAVEAGLGQAIQAHSKSNALLSTDEEMSAMESDDHQGISFSAQPWGLVLELDQNATQMVIHGISIAGAISTTLAAFAAITEIGAPVAVVAGVFAGFCAISATIIAAVSNGNGIYLTITWPQIALILLFPPVPVPTAR